MPEKRRKNDCVHPKDDISDEERELREREEIARSMPDNIASALANARSKPAWCSPTRWRMEMKRRERNRRGIWV